MRRRWNELPTARRRLSAGCGAVMLLAIAALLLLPAGRESAMALANRVFARSEAVNAYVYDRFAVPEGTSGAMAAAALVLALAGWLTLAFAWPGKGPALALAVTLAAGQAYLGLSLPAAANAAAFGLLGAAMLRRGGWRQWVCLAAAALVLAALVAAVWPGTDAGVEAASEWVRDRLENGGETARVSEAESEDSYTAVRHENRRDLAEGEQPARPGEEYRLVTVEQQQIALPHWIDYLRIALLCLLVPLVLAAPFAPFVWLNARTRRTAQRRSCLEGEDDTAAAVGAFGLVIGYLDACHIGGENSLYAQRLTGVTTLPEGYAQAYREAVLTWEAAVYGARPVTAAQREQLTNLLEETEKMLYDAADLPTRLRLKYGYCLHE